MIAYWLLFLLFAIGTSWSFLNRFSTSVGSAAAHLKPTAGKALSIAALITTLLVGLRFEIGTDWLTYLTIFKFIARADLWHSFNRIDPGYALAWTGLAETHRRTLFGADARPSDAFEPADLAIRHALALVPDLAEARAEQAFKLYWFDFDWPGAEREFRRALAINPNVAAARFGLASLLLNQDRPDEGFAQLRMSRELDPMSPVYNTLEASYLLAAGRRDEARVRLHRALDIAPGFWLAHCTQALLHLADHETDQAIALLAEVWKDVEKALKPYVHQWKPTDMLAWDNWRMLHMACGCNPEQERIMHRTTIKGDYGLGRWETPPKPAAAPADAMM